MSITSGSPPLRARTPGAVIRFIGAGVGVARLVEVSIVYLDMPRLLAASRADGTTAAATFFPLIPAQAGTH